MGSVILTKIVKDPVLDGCPSHSSASLDIVSSYFTIRANLSVTLCNATNYWVRSGVCFDQDVYQVQMSGELPGFGLSCYWEILVHT